MCVGAVYVIVYLQGLLSVTGMNVLLVMVNNVKCITWHTSDLLYLWCLQLQ